MRILSYIKNVIDGKVYDRNDILKQDAYFEKTIMVQTKQGLVELKIDSDRKDREFIQKRIAKQYLDQYNDTYAGEMEI